MFYYFVSRVSKLRYSPLYYFKFVSRDDRWISGCQYRFLGSFFLDKKSLNFFYFLMDTLFKIGEMTRQAATNGPHCLGGYRAAVRFKYI